MTEHIHVQNDGQNIAETNYFKTPNAQAGYVYLTTNAGAMRLLVPPPMEGYVVEMKTAREIIVSRGPWPAQGRDDAVEILFDDDSESPYVLHIAPEQCDRLPPAEESGRSVVFSVWTAGPAKRLERPGRYRVVDRIPFLKPWKDSRDQPGGA